MLCHYVTPSTTHMASSTGEVFPIKDRITCTTKNVIYDLWCDKCRNSATPNPGSDHYKAVSQHFNLPGHSASDMRFLPFESVKGDRILLESREQYWINKKRTFEMGINRQK